MNSKFYLAVLLLLAGVSIGSVSGQDHIHDHNCHVVKSKQANAKNAAKTTVNHEDEDKYDVNYVKLNLEMSNISTTLSGDVTTRAKVVAPTMAAYVFELRPPLVIDSVKIDGALQSVTRMGDTCIVPLPAALPMGTMFTAQVFYHGTPVSGTPSDIFAISCLQSPSWGNWATFTVSQPYSAEDWWPCKQSLRDKIDSVDIWVTVSDSLMVGSNGLLQAVTPMGGSRNRYEWKERYPIDYYLVSVAVANYTDYSYYMHFTGSADSMLVQNYIYNNPAVLSLYKTRIDFTADLVNYFSTIYGRYPFWKEKYGHSMAPLSGGMENQTMTTLGFFENWLVAHELGHQWFGDNVTCGSWSDIAINEGFASYSEYLYLDHFQSHAAATSDMVGRQEDVMSELGGTVFVADTVDEARTFSHRLTYNKGACVVHTLRQVLDNDAFFFDLLRGWQAIMKDSTGTIADLRELTKVMFGATVNGINIDTFFHQWFYQEGYPAYTAQWNKSGSDVYVRIDQATTVPSSVSLFKVPLDIRLTSPTGDTLIRIVNDQPSQFLHFTWSKAMNNLEIDPNQWLTDSVTSITKVPYLGMADVQFGAVKVYPNPGITGWNVDGVPANSTMVVTDITGKTIWQSATGNTTSMAIPAAQLSSGIYLLRISNDMAGERVFKLIKG